MTNNTRFYQAEEDKLMVPMDSNAVLTATSRIIYSEDGADTQFQTADGRYLTLGYYQHYQEDYGYTYYDSIFTPTSYYRNPITLVWNDMASRWSISNGGTYLKYTSYDVYESGSGSNITGYSWGAYSTISPNSYNPYYPYNFEIWTDANVISGGLGDQRYVEIETLDDLTNLQKDEELLLVYTDPSDDSSYTLTSRGADGNALDVSVRRIVSDGLIKTVRNEINTDRLYAWTLSADWACISREDGIWENILKQDDMYLLPLDSTIYSDGENQYHYMRFYIEENEDGTAAFYIGGNKDTRYLGWEDGKFTPGNAKDDAIKVRIFKTAGDQAPTVFNTYYRLTDLSRLPDVDKFVIVVDTGEVDENGKAFKFAIGKSNGRYETWQLPVEVLEDNDGDGSASRQYVVIPTSEDYEVQFSLGDLYSTDKKDIRWDYRYLQLGGGLYWKPQNLNNMLRVPIDPAYPDITQLVLLSARKLKRFASNTMMIRVRFISAVMATIHS